MQRSAQLGQGGRAKLVILAFQAFAIPTLASSLLASDIRGIPSKLANLAKMSPRSWPSLHSGVATALSLL
jgi:hypothetical protein